LTKEIQWVRNELLVSIPDRVERLWGEVPLSSLWLALSPLRLHPFGKSRLFDPTPHKRPDQCDGSSHDQSFKPGLFLDQTGSIILILWESRCIGVIHRLSIKRIDRNRYFEEPYYRETFKTKRSIHSPERKRAQAEFMIWLITPHGDNSLRNVRHSSGMNGLRPEAWGLKPEAWAIQLAIGFIFEKQSPILTNLSCPN
jgi:hypothetical protein